MGFLPAQESVKAVCLWIQLWPDPFTLLLAMQRRLVRLFNPKLKYIKGIFKVTNHQGLFLGGSRLVSWFRLWLKSCSPCKSTWVGFLALASESSFLFMAILGGSGDESSEWVLVCVRPWFNFQAPASPPDQPRPQWLFEKWTNRWELACLVFCASLLLYQSIETNISSLYLLTYFFIAISQISFKFSFEQWSHLSFDCTLSLSLDQTSASPSLRATRLSITQSSIQRMPWFSFFLQLSELISRGGFFYPHPNNLYFLMLFSISSLWKNVNLSQISFISVS